MGHVGNELLLRLLGHLGGGNVADRDHFSGQFLPPVRQVVEGNLKPFPRRKFGKGYFYGFQGFRPQDIVLLSGIGEDIRILDDGRQGTIDDILSLLVDQIEHVPVDVDDVFLGIRDNNAKKNGIEDIGGMSSVKGGHTQA